MDSFLDILQEGANAKAVDALSSSDSEPDEVACPADPAVIVVAQVNAVTRLLSDDSPRSVFLRERHLLPTQNPYKLYTAGQGNTVIEACFKEMVTAAREMGVDEVFVVPSKAAIDAVGQLLASPLFNMRWSMAAGSCLGTKLRNRAHYFVRQRKRN